MTRHNRTRTEALSAAPFTVTLAGTQYPVQPLPFGEACVWIDRALEVLDNFQDAGLNLTAMDQTNIKTMRVIIGKTPRMLELVFEFMGIGQEERDKIQAAMGLDLSASINEVAMAFNRCIEIAAPFQGAAPQTEPKASGAARS